VKIAHLVPTLHPDSPEIGLVDLAAGAREVGFEMVVIALSTTSDTTQVSALRRLGVPVAELNSAPWDPRAIPRVARLLRDRAAQLVHTHLPQADVVGAGAALRNRIPAVSTLHRIENMPADRSDRLKRTARILARQRFMSRTIAISNTQREWYRGLAGPDPKIILEPNGVIDPGPIDEAVRERRRAALEIEPNDVVALSTAPMRRDQGHEMLLDAVEALPDDIPLILALAGDGPLRPWLESRVNASEELTDRVRFVHRQHDPTQLLAAADFAVHTATSGALPTALLRAMAEQRPIVATRVGGVPEVVAPGTGILVQLSASALSNALARMTDDTAARLAMGEKARARFLSEYEAVGWAGRLRKVYESVLS
jgi:glycosyltransferase involved in cell wall biosynthesis